MFEFVKHTGMICLEGEKKQKLDTPNSFLEHPSGEKGQIQLWGPFHAAFLLNQPDNSTIIAGDLVKVDVLIMAIKACKRRLFGLSSVPTRDIEINTDQQITPAAKLYLENVVYSSTIFTQRLSVSNKRGGEYVMFHSNHTKAG